MSKDFSTCNSSETLVRGIGLCSGALGSLLKEEPGEDDDELALREEMQAASLHTGDCTIRVFTVCCRD